MTLNKNPDNYFAQIEQMALSPSNLVPGIEASPDKMLQGRLFAYDDTHRHRLGPNFNQLPVNLPKCPLLHFTQRDGPMCFGDNLGGAPNYFPNSFLNPKDNPKYKEHRWTTTPDVDRHDSSNDDNYSQVTDFWLKVLKPDEQDRLVNNVAGHLVNAQQFLQERALSVFDKVHPDYGNKVRLALKKIKVIKYAKLKLKY